MVKEELKNLVIAYAMTKVNIREFGMLSDALKSVARRALAADFDRNWEFLSKCARQPSGTEGYSHVVNTLRAMTMSHRHSDGNLAFFEEEGKIGFTHTGNCVGDSGATLMVAHEGDIELCDVLVEGVYNALIEISPFQMGFEMDSLVESIFKLSLRGKFDYPSVMGCVEKHSSKIVEATKLPLVISKEVIVYDLLRRIIKEDDDDSFIKSLLISY